jgi:hypothetical protein
VVRPDPKGAADLNNLVARLRLRKAWAGDPSYTLITRRINEEWLRVGRPASELPGRSTMAGYFSAGRSRLDEDLLAAIAAVLGGDPEYAERRRAAVRVIRGRATRPGCPRSRSSVLAMILWSEALRAEQDSAAQEVETGSAIH